MKQLKPWYALDINVKNAIRNDFSFNKMLAESQFSDSPAGIWFIKQEELSNMFSKEWLDYMNSLSLEVGNCFIFYRAPHYLHNEVHIDTHHLTGKAAVYGLNWVIDPADDSDMIWYEPLDTQGDNKLTQADSTYYSWPLDAFKDKPYVSRSIKQQMTLVNTGLPHNVIVREKSRWSISMRFPVDKFNIVDWQSAAEYFKPYIIE
jgi:hypothetical protein